MAALLLGPLLRHVGERDATIWVETDAACEVTVRAGDATGRATTFKVGDHHYAVVVLSGLAPASSTSYEVLLGQDLVWPEAKSPFPPSRIRTVDPSRPVRLLFGSCREPPAVRPLDKHLDPDAFDAYANRMATRPPEDWPDVLLLLGDQVYADDTSAHVREFIGSRRDMSLPPGAEVANFEEYTRLYYESWGEPTVRWLLSTLPSSMIFDDHDVRDDWNTSHAWRVDMQRTDWWQERIIGALMSYWIYQHLGNLSPGGLESNELYQAVLASDDAETILRDFAQAADREADGAKGAQWSYRRDFGSVRLLVIDSRCGRVLDGDRRSMVSDPEFDWIEQQTDDGQFDHLVVASSMPWLLPRALHDIESWNEALCAGSRGRRIAQLSERVRRAVDLEHWAAFRLSFDRLARWFVRIGQGGSERIGQGGSERRGPATICVLSGDVHHTYVSEAEFKEMLETRVFQVTCSPIHNTIPLAMRLVFRAGWSRKVERVIKFLDRWARVPPLTFQWHQATGPHFGNMLGTLVLDGRQAHVLVERAVRAIAPVEGAPPAKLEIMAELSLTEPRPVAP